MGALVIVAVWVIMGTAFGFLIGPMMREPDDETVGVFGDSREQ